MYKFLLVLVYTACCEYGMVGIELRCDPPLCANMTRSHSIWRDTYDFTVEGAAMSIGYWRRKHLTIDCKGSPVLGSSAIPRFKQEAQTSFLLLNSCPITDVPLHRVLENLNVIFEQNNESTISIEGKVPTASQITERHFVGIDILSGLAITASPTQNCAAIYNIVNKYKGLKYLKLDGVILDIYRIPKTVNQLILVDTTIGPLIQMLKELGFVKTLTFFRVDVNNTLNDMHTNLLNSEKLQRKSRVLSNQGVESQVLETKSQPCDEKSQHCEATTHLSDIKSHNGEEATKRSDIKSHNGEEATKRSDIKSHNGEEATKCSDIKSHYGEEATKFSDIKSQPDDVTTQLSDTKLTTSIEKLWLIYWKYRHLPAMEYCDNLRELHLGSPQVEFLPEKWISSCTLLKKISISKAKNLVSLPEKLLQGAKVLEEFSISESHLESIPRDLLVDAKCLKKLTLHRGRLQALPDRFMETATNLVEVDLSMNEIKTISSDTFFGPSLETLNLGFNELNNEALEVLSTMKSLTDLNLQQNRLILLCDEQDKSRLSNLARLRKLILTVSMPYIRHLCTDLKDKAELVSGVIWSKY